MQVTTGSATINIPTNSLIVLDGGVLQSNPYSSFTRPLGTQRQRLPVDRQRRRFCRGPGGSMWVNIGGDLRTVSWGTSVGSQIVGTLKLSSSTSQDLTNFQNPINLGSGARTVFVDDNPASSGDYAMMSGNISGSGSLVKTGPGTLIVSGTNSSYTGGITVQRRHSHCAEWHVPRRHHQQRHAEPRHRGNAHRRHQRFRPGEHHWRRRDNAQRRR